MTNSESEKTPLCRVCLTLWPDYLTLNQQSGFGHDLNAFGTLDQVLLTVRRSVFCVREELLLAQTLTFLRAFTSIRTFIKH